MAIYVIRLSDTHLLLFPYFIFMYIVISKYITSLGALSSNHDSVRVPGQHSNLTYKQISALLRREGYEVVEFSDMPPLALDGDVAYQASAVLSELRGPKERAETQAAPAPFLWMDNAGNAELFYFFDTKKPPNKKIFEASVLAWSKHTCIKFTKIQDRPCKTRLSHGSVCVGNFGGCFSPIGNQVVETNGYAQVSSVEGCDLYSSAHELGHGIGFHHYSMRADRDQYLTVNFHHYRIGWMKGSQPADRKWRSVWKAGRKCKKKTLYQTSTPIPYDYLSIMGYSEADMGDEDFRLIYVTKDPRHQYLLDFKKYSGILTTHLDRYLMNLIYKCSEKWSQSCRAQGTEPPKCKNFGYVKKDCTCACTDGTKGSACEQNLQGSYPPRLDRAKTIVEYPGSGQFTLKQHSKMESPPPAFPDPEFIYHQYATIVLKSRDDKTLASVRVFEPGEVSQNAKLKSSVNQLIKEMHFRDCELGLNLYWGDFPTGRTRTECFSSLVNNEPEANALVLRAWTREIGLVLIGKQGLLLASTDFTKDMLEKLQFQVSFLPDANRTMTEKPINDGSDARPPPLGTGDSDSDDSDSDSDSNATSSENIITGDSTGAALTSPGKAVGLSWLAMIPLALCCVLFVLLFKRKRKAADGDDASKDGSVHHSHSDDEDDGGSSEGSDDSE